MSVQDILQFAASNGFAMVVAAYCLIQNNKTVQENTVVTSKLCSLIDKLCDVMGVDKDSLQD